MPSQHMTALKRANEIRLARAALKRRIAAGETSLADVVLKPPTEIEGMPIDELLKARRRWGRTRTLRALALAQVSEGRRVGALTARQREAIARITA